MPVKPIALLLCLFACPAVASETDSLVQSPGDTTYYINPSGGDDRQSGLSEALAWRSFARVNRMVFSPGDRIEITAPGAFDQTLKISGAGSRRSPIDVRFAPGRYDFHPVNALRRT